MKTKWKQLCDYVHTKKKGEIITRKELVEKFGEIRKNGYTAIDTYRMILYNLGVLRTTKFGHYVVEKHLKKYITVSEARKLAYDESWKTWFMAPDFLKEPPK